MAKDIRVSFAYGATLRIDGTLEGRDDPARIPRRLGLRPTHVHRKGERRSASAPPYRHDAWHYTAPVAVDQHLNRHLTVLWAKLKPHVRYRKALKHRQDVDVFCTFRTNTHLTGIEVDLKALEILRRLELSFGLSITIQCYVMFGPELDPSARRSPVVVPSPRA